MALDWSHDEFMRGWDQKYVSTNLSSDAPKYNQEFFASVNDSLAAQKELKSFSYALVVRFDCCMVATGLNKDS